jgi:hypothetical protein
MNFDEVNIDLGHPERHNLLGETGQMEWADCTDAVEAVEVLSIDGSGNEWGVEHYTKVNPLAIGVAREGRKHHFVASKREITFSLTRNGQYQGRVIFNTELGSVELSPDSNTGALEGVKMRVRVTRINYNRRPR